MNPRTRRSAILAGALAAALAIAVLYGMNADFVQPGGVLEKPESLAGLTMTEDPYPLPDAEFFDAGGAPVTLADFAGKFLVLNMWATWCAPCVAELPALARAQAALPEDVLILPVDTERLEPERVSAFLAENGAGSLPVYIDRNFALIRGFDAFAVGLPYTIFIDESGTEIATASGPQEWDDPAAIAYIRQLALGPRQ